MEPVRKLFDGYRLTKREYTELLKLSADPQKTAWIKSEAVRVRKIYYGNKIFLRGLIEFTNYCKNNCYYCGIRRDNRNILRYRLSTEEILECCRKGYELGFRSFVLQGGEDPYFTDERIVDIVRKIRFFWKDCAVTLSIGEKSRESFKRFREAGAERYLLRQETADEAHYRKLHPQEMCLQVRKQCLYDLKELGYQTGAGFLVGSPGQTEETLAEDLLFLENLKPHMVGIGPFIPHHETKFAAEKAGSVQQTLFLMALIRLMLPKVLLPATTALLTLDASGRELAMEAGANVLMPNISPFSKRKQYELYHKKLFTGAETAEGLQELKQQMKEAGWEIVTERGDFPEETDIN